MRLPLRLAILLLLLATCCRAADFATVFAWTAQQHGAARAYGVTLLQPELTAQRDWLAGRDGAWNEVVLARCLLRLLDRPDGLTAVRTLAGHALIISSTEGCTAITETDGTEISTPFHRQDVPLIAEMVIESSLNSDGNLPPALASAVSLLADPLYVGPLLSRAPYRESQELVDLLGVCATKDRRYLFETLRKCPPGKPGITNTDSDTTLLDQARFAAMALGLLGDREAVPLLVAGLTATAYGPLGNSYSRALGQIGDSRAQTALLDRLVSLALTLQGQNYRPFPDFEYADVRTGLLGCAERNFLSARQQLAGDIVEQALLAGLLHDFDHGPQARARYKAVAGDLLAAEGLAAESLAAESLAAKNRLDAQGQLLGARYVWSRRGQDLSDPTLPTDLIIERAAVFGNETDLAHVANMRQHPLAYPVLARAAFFGKNLLSFAGIYGERTLPVLLQWMEKNPRDPAWAAVGLAIGTPAAQSLLETARKASHPTERQHLDAALAVLADPAAGLRSNDAALNEAAAILLARRRDPRAIAPLFVLASTRTSFEPGSRQTQAHERYRLLRDLLLGYGEALPPALANFARPGQPWRETLLIEVLRLRQTRSDMLAAPGAAAKSLGAGAFGYHGGPTLAMLEASAKALALSLGRDGIPLLEETVALGGEVSQPNIAALALASFAEPRSLAPLIAYVEDSGSGRDDQVGARALLHFGEAGAAALRALPTPNPDKPGYGQRYGRQSKAASALATLDHDSAIRAIVTGLNLPTPQGGTVSPLLRLAIQHPDPQILDALLPHAEQLLRSAPQTFLSALVLYDDPRIAAVALQHLGTIRPETSYGSNCNGGEEALSILARMHGTNLHGVLQALLHSPESGLRHGGAWGLGHLHTTSDWRDGQAPSMFAEDIWKLAGFVDITSTDADFVQRNREAITAVLPLLEDSNDEVTIMAAKVVTALSLRTQASDSDSPNGLVVTYTIADRQAIVPLAAWLARRKQGLPGVFEYLAADGSPESLRACLTCYRSGGCSEEAAAAALGQPGFDEAIPALRQGLQHACAHPHEYANFAALPALAAIGGPGGTTVVDTIRNADAPLRARIIAAEVGYAAAGWLAATIDLWRMHIAAAPPPDKTIWMAIHLAKALINHGGAEGRAAVETGLLTCHDGDTISVVVTILTDP